MLVHISLNFTSLSLGNHTIVRARRESERINTGKRYTWICKQDNAPGARVIQTKPKTHFMGHPLNLKITSQKAKSMGPAWCPPGSCRPLHGRQVGPMNLANRDVTTQSNPSISLWYLTRYICEHDNTSVLFETMTKLHSVSLCFPKHFAKWYE